MRQASPERQVPAGAGNAKSPGTVKGSDTRVHRSMKVTQQCVHTVAHIGYTHVWNPQFRSNLVGAITYIKNPEVGGVPQFDVRVVDGPFDREGWAFEVKWDGFRSLAAIKGGKVRLLSRNGKAQNARFPTVAAALSGFPVDAVFDGEIVAVDAEGRPHFQDLQNSMRAGEVDLEQDELAGVTYRAANSFASIWRSGCSFARG